MPPAWSADAATERHVHGCTVRGVQVGPETRCVHYHGPQDVIALRFACCGDWFPCYRCHAARADHEPAVWPRDAFDTEAVLCGVCGHCLTIRGYLAGALACPACRAAFNPRCRRHWHLYFAMDAPDESSPPGVHGGSPGSRPRTDG